MKVGGKEGGRQGCSKLVARTLNVDQVAKNEGGVGKRKYKKSNKERQKNKYESLLEEKDLQQNRRRKWVEE